MNGPTQIAWPPAPPTPLLPPPGVVWCWRIWAEPVDGEPAGRLSRLLAAEERERAARFAHAADRRLYVAAHAGLRLLLGAALGGDPAALRLRQAPGGKPQLAGDRVLEFNLSHSGGIALIAIARGFPVGVDVERVRPLRDLEAIGVRYLHPAERAELAAYAAPAAQRAFFRCWTCKEAVAKALGFGLALRFNDCRVACRPDAPATLLALDGVEPPPSQWSLHDLAPTPCHIAALAAAHPGVSVVCRTLVWPD